MKMGINLIKAGGKIGKAIVGGIAAVGIGGLAQVAKKNGPKIIKAVGKVIKNNVYKNH